MEAYRWQPVSSDTEPNLRAMPSKVLLAEPRGFCAGVEMAIKALTWMVKVFDPPVYCYHEIVHNAAVVQAFEAAGVVFVDDISDAPKGSPIMLSAHGSAPAVVSEATDRAAVMVDAVCPLVTKVHHEVRRMAAKGYDILYVGHEGHDEAIGAIAEAPEATELVDPRVGMEAFTSKERTNVALLAQTTLGLYEWEGVLDEAQDLYPDLWTARKSDLCYATTNRQSAVQALADRADVILVVGSENSSNTQALVRVGRKAGGSEPPDRRAGGRPRGVAHGSRRRRCHGGRIGSGSARAGRDRGHCAERWRRAGLPDCRGRVLPTSPTAQAADGDAPASCGGWIRGSAVRRTRSDRPRSRLLSDRGPRPPRTLRLQPSRRGRARLQPRRRCRCRSCR